MEIQATPYEAKKVTFNIEFGDIVNVYKGQLNCCRCGCQGTYYKPDEDEDMIKMGMKLMQQYSERRDEEVKYEVFNDELYFEIHTDTRFDTHEEYPEEMGWGFYLKKTDETTKNI